MAQVLEAGKNLVIIFSLYHLNIAGTTDITQILKLWKYLVITCKLYHLKIQEQAYNVGTTQVMNKGRILSFHVQHIICSTM